MADENAIAIVGMAARLPGADGIDQFWSNLLAGVESVGPANAEDLRTQGVKDASLKNPDYRLVHATADELDAFDTEVFGYTPREAEITDPQQRLFLELAHTALQHAGFDHRRLSGRVAVFGGAGTNNYREWHVERNRAVFRSVPHMSIRAGNNPDYIAPMVSYRLGFNGPSVSVYTACSTSLVAVHQACQSLRLRECEVALAGGVQVEVPLGGGYVYRQGSIYSEDGHVRPFAANASGTIFGSGGALVALMTLEAARKAGCTVHAVIRGSAVNNDGAERVGFTAPGIAGQRMLVLNALADAGVDARSIGMVEAHGTGTVVGDPIEFNALVDAYRTHTADTGYCVIGSVKGNVGHLGPAAGTVGLIKAVRAVNTGLVPPSINCDELNPALDMAASPFVFGGEPTEWPADMRPFRAAISSFGIGGTNAHLIIEAPPEQARPVGGRRRWHALPLSTAGPEALQAASAQLAEHLERHDVALSDVAHTLQQGRTEYRDRRIVVADTRENAAAALRGLGTPALAGAGRSAERSVAFLFPGQGAQYPGMGRGLYEANPVFREAVDRCCENIAPHLGFDLKEVLLADPSDEDAAARLTDTAVTQPALLILEWSLAQVWADWGVRPAAMIGHSVGEYTAACLAGVFELPDALKLIATRGALMASLPAGSMIAVSAAADTVRPLLPPEVEIAAGNSPSACVVSGPGEAVEPFGAELAGMGLSVTPLRTSHAFHSAMVDPVLERFEAAVAAVPRRAPSLPFLSNVTGEWITDEEAASPAYWAAQVRREVRFAAGVDKLVQREDLALLEIGPGQTLVGFARQQSSAPGRLTAVPSLPPRWENVEEEAHLAAAAGKLWTAGIGVDWTRVNGDPAARRVPLPTYPYQRQRCWVNPDPVGPDVREAEDEEPAARLARPFSLPLWHPVPRRTGADPLGEHWLVIGTGDAGYQELVAAAQAAGVLVTEAVSGPSFAETPAGYEFDPAEQSDVDAVVGEIWDRGQLPDRILYSLELRAAEGEDTAAAARAAYARMARLARALCRVVRDELEIVAVTDRARVLPGERHLPWSTPLLGPLMTLPRELPSLRTRHVDLDATGRTDRSAAAVVREVCADNPAEQVALRGHRRHVLRYERITDEPVDHRREDPVRPGGVYLITGGLGGLGLAVAEDFARRNGARLILVGRSGLPPREEWDALLAGGADTALRRRIEGVRRLEELGAEVLVCGADVGEPEQMAAAVAAGTARFGPINGVIHAAGLSGGQLLAAHDQDTADRVLRPKINGALVLRELLAAGRLGDEVDFVALFSSITTASMDYGLCDYVAANLFMDECANNDGGRDPYVVAIDWCGWNEVGMVSQAGGSETFLRYLRLRKEIEHADLLIDHPLLDQLVLDDPDRKTFEVKLEPDGHWVLTDHRIKGEGVLPATSVLEMVHAAARHLYGARPMRLRDVLYIDPIAVTEPTIGRVVFTPQDGDGTADPVRTWQFTVAFDTEKGDGQVQCRGTIGLVDAEPPPPVDVDRHRSALPEHPVEDRDTGLVELGPRFDLVRRFYADSERGLLDLRVAAEDEGEAGSYWLHPGLLDRAVYGLSSLDGRSYLPFTHRSVTVWRPLPPACSVVQTYRADPARPDFIEIDQVLVDADGEVCVEVEGYTLRAVESTDAARRPAARTDAAGSHGGTETMLGTGEATAILRRLLAVAPGPQVYVSVEPVTTRIERMRAFTGENLQGAAAQPAAGTGERKLDVPYVAPETELERVLTGLWGESVGVGEVGVDDDYFLLGGSSLTAVQLTSRIRDKLAVDVSVADIFDYPTVRRMRTVAEERLGALVDELDDDEVRAILDGGEAR
ncbi:type I polyketide synthase [Allonocardiopsis opalescens]|uniref:Acyl transferase domain-containing protein n=1 Tax=Allonocardiopsis opalescens TaxID=1144618 RepID=A0A2T0PYH7_9ACTN|nr:type I polyketide synthase [Allonocardiopsis opalescens]PRX96568.1 acyl transferase domain-containing protein [Allonocardiopsis opalescens]